MVSTEVYLGLVINQPCPKCNQIDVSTRKYSIKIIGLLVKVTSKCCICHANIEQSNESSGMDFSKAMAGAGLVGGVNREELCIILGLCGITCQSGPAQYFAKQEEFFEELKKSATESAQKALHTTLTNQCDQNHFTLEVGFDFSWSHVRNAKEVANLSTMEI